MNDFINIGDERIRAIKTKGSPEELVDLRDYGFIVDESRSQIANRSVHFTKVRKTVAEKLLEAQKKLPAGIDFFVKEGYRPISQQLKSYEKVKSYFRENNPEFDEDRIKMETNKLCSPVEVAPHPTGAAVDLTLIYVDTHRELDLGTEYNAVPHDTGNATFIDAENISAEAKKNRMILKVAMEFVGFVCYPSEWWHWSYGDKYWAFEKKVEQALYSTIEEKHLEDHIGNIMRN